MSGTKPQNQIRELFTKSALREYASAPSRKASIRQHGSRRPGSTRSNVEEVVYAPSNLDPLFCQTEYRLPILASRPDRLLRIPSQLYLFKVGIGFARQDSNLNIE